MDWEMLKNKRQRSSWISYNGGNNSRINKEYKKEDKILIVLNKIEQDSKLNYLTEGHFTIVKVYNNGTIKRTTRKFQLLGSNHTTI